MCHSIMKLWYSFLDMIYLEADFCNLLKYTLRTGYSSDREEKDGRDKA